MQRKFVLVSILFLSFGVCSTAVQAGGDLPSLFEEIRQGLSALSLSPERDTNLRNLLDIAEQKANDGVTASYTVEELVEAFLLELIVPFLSEDNDIAIQILRRVDDIRSLLFARVPPLTLVPPSEPVAPSAGNCNVRMVYRVVGPLAADPGGTILLPFASPPLQLEAVATPPGGTFSWVENFSEENTPGLQPNRYYSRNDLDNRIKVLEVFYEGPGGESCQDVLWIQGVTPDPDDL